MADKLFSEVVAQWIDAHTWPRSTGRPQSILVLTATNPAGTVFNFHSAFSYFEIQGTYNKGTGSLANVQIQLVVPGHPNATTLIAADSYPLSTADGEPIPFNIDNGYIEGRVSFKYADQNGQHNIFVTYSVNLPYAGDLEDTINIAPTQLSEAVGFTTAELKAIPTFTPSELKLEEEKALVSSKSGRVAVRALDEVTDNQQALLVKFLKDFVVGQDSVVIETYYAPPTGALDTTLPASGFSSQWKGTITCLGILELVGSIDPETLAISAVLYARVPIAGRVHLLWIGGSLLGGGVTAHIDVILASGTATFTASKNSSGIHDLYIDANLTIKFMDKITTSGKVHLYSLPF